MLNFVHFFAIGLLSLMLSACMGNPPTLPPDPPPPPQEIEHTHHDHLDMVPCVAPVKTVKIPAPPPYVVELKPSAPLAQHKPANFQLRILTPTGQVVKHKNFRVMHGQRVHALIIDPALLDYQHIHLRPEDLSEKALYEFTITPHQTGQYKIYLDVVDEKNKQYFLEGQFVVPGGDNPPVFDNSLSKGSIQTLALSGDLQFSAQVEKPIQAKEHVMLNITVRQGKKLFRQLEPTMQAYAHLVGFNADRSRLIHAHPMGDEPRSSNQRGGPNLKFGVQFPKSGNYRLLLQIKVDDKDLFVPFDVKVL